MGCIKLNRFKAHDCVESNEIGLELLMFVDAKTKKNNLYVMCFEIMLMSDNKKGNCLHRKTLKFGKLMFY